ncbi:MAG: sterol desaturase family protein [Actinomycetota bacterium]
MDTKRLPPPLAPDPALPSSEPRPRRRAVAAVKVVLALAAVAGGLAIDRSGPVIVAVLFILVVPFEQLFPRHDQPFRRPELGTDLGYALAGPLLQVVGLAAGAVVGILSLAWLPGLALRPLVGMIPPALAPLVGVVLFDLAIYWTHRWYHEVPVLWRFHSIHHSPTHMDWISGLRSHPLDGTLIAPAFVFLLAAGFSAEVSGAIAVLQIAVGIFLHANVRWRLRPLHRIVATPEFHHWHHANEPGAVNSNYAGLLPAWDQVFGTYFLPRHRRPRVYGVNESVPAGMVDQLRYPFRGSGNPLSAVRHPRRALRSTIRFVRRLCLDLARSTRRPRRQGPEDLGPPIPGLRFPPPEGPPAPW